LTETVGKTNKKKKHPESWLQFTALNGCQPTESPKHEHCTRMHHHTGRRVREWEEPYFVTVRKNGDDEEIKAQRKEVEVEVRVRK